MKKATVLSIMLSVVSDQSFSTQATPIRPPSAIISQAPTIHWRAIDHDNTLVIELATGQVVVELNPLLAPNHVTQLKTLAREGFYDGLNFYRFVEGFVAQGGDVSEQKLIKHGAKSIKSERVHYANKALTMTELPSGDGYAATTGFINGFAIASKKSQKQYWQTHCPGAFAMARNEDPDSAGTEFYVVIGQAPRYLDRNLTVFGQVRQGIEHLQTLKRRPVTDHANNIIDNQIIAINVAADLAPDKRIRLSVMDTNSASFIELIQSRMNRPETFFIERPNYVDVCAVTVPVREN